MKPVLLAIGTVAVGFVAGVTLIALDFVLIGIIVACAALPLALGVLITAGDR